MVVLSGSDIINSAKYLRIVGHYLKKNEETPDKYRKTIEELARFGLIVDKNALKNHREVLMKAQDDNFDSEEEMSVTRRESERVLVDLTANTTEKGELINLMGVIARNLSEINQSIRLIAGAQNFTVKTEEKLTSIHQFNSSLADEIVVI